MNHFLITTFALLYSSSAMAQESKFKFMTDFFKVVETFINKDIAGILGVICTMAAVIGLIRKSIVAFLVPAIAGGIFFGFEGFLGMVKQLFTSGPS